jgi:hypothetical protein
MLVLPPHLEAAMRQVARQEAQQLQEQYGATRAELEMLRAVVMEKLCKLSATDRDCLANLLTGLAGLWPGKWVSAAEILDYAPDVVGPGGDALRAACANFTTRPAPSKALGKFLARVVAVPIGGVYLKRH